MDGKRSRGGWAQGLALGCVLAAGLGCRTVPSLRPAPNAEAAPDDLREELGERAAVARVAGIEVAATTEGWAGPIAVPTHVTVMKLAIRNTSDRRVRLGHKRFRLVAEAEGQIYKAMAPQRIRSGAINQLTDPFGSIQPIWFGRGYALHGPYASVFRLRRGVWPTNYPILVGPTLRSRPFIGTRYIYAHPLLAYGLPPGVLSPGGEVEGWIFFRRVASDLPALTLAAELVDADTREIIGTARIPFRNENLLRKKDAPELEFCPEPEDADAPAGAEPGGPRTEPGGPRT